MKLVQDGVECPKCGCTNWWILEPKTHCLLCDYWIINAKVCGSSLRDSVKGLVKLRNRSHDWNEDASFEDGLLDRNCQKCNSFFLGGKDRNFCKVCHLNAEVHRTDEGGSV